MFTLKDIYERREEFIQAFKATGNCKGILRKIIAAKNHREKFMDAIRENIGWMPTLGLLNMSYIKPQKHGKFVCIDRKRKAGIFSIDGDMIIPNQYEDCCILKNHFIARMNNKLALIDYSNNPLNYFAYDTLRNFNEDDGFVYLSTGDMWHIYNQNAELMFQVKTKNVMSTSQRYFCLRDSDGVRIIGVNGETKYSSTSEAITRIALCSRFDYADIQDRNQWSVYDLVNQKYLIQPIECNELLYLAEHKIGIVSFGQATGIIDTNNKYLLEPCPIKLHNCWTKPFVYIDRKTGKKGFLGMNGKRITPGIYDEISTLSNTVWRKVKIGKLYGIIDCEGNTIEEAIHPKIGKFKKDGTYSVFTETKKRIPGITK